MLLPKKLVITFSTSFIILTSLPFICSSNEHVKTNSSHTVGTEDKLSRRLLFEVTLHGFLLWASMGFLMPVGILAIRLSNGEQCGRRLKIMFYIHANAQILSVILSTAAAIMSIKNFENSFKNYHQRMGIVLYAVIWLQALSGFLRPQRGSTRRSAWFFVHWLLGTAVSLLGIIHIYTGLQAYQKKTSKSVKLWIMLFTAEISFIALFYLFQDKWNYVQKQGVMLGNETIQPTDQEIYPRDKQKEAFTGRPS